MVLKMIFVYMFLRSKGRILKNYLYSVLIVLIVIMVVIQKGDVYFLIGKGKLNRVLCIDYENLFNFLEKGDFVIWYI